MTTDRTEVLRQTDLLRLMPGEDLKAVIGASRLRAFRRGQVVFITGDPGDTLIVVISGRVKVVVRSVRGASGAEFGCRQPAQAGSRCTTGP